VNQHAQPVFCFLKETTLALRVSVKKIFLGLAE
jgi:hypothetical protein